MLNILIAEDDDSSARLLGFYLNKSGHSYKITQNGQEAMEALNNETYDVLFTDWMMPKMDGIQLIRSVRKELQNIPLIVMITGLAPKEARSLALDSGADGYIKKPYKESEIFEVLGSLETKIENRCNTGLPPR